MTSTRFRAAAWRTPDTDARLRDLWADGVSTLRIAAALGVTKGQVIGLVHRMRLPARPSPVEPAARAAARVRPLGVAPLPVAVREQLARQPSAAPARLPAPAPPEPRGLVVRPARDAVRDGCRWPLWSDTDRPDGRFCGERITPGWQPYCDQCRARGTRRRVAEAA